MKIRKALVSWYPILISVAMLLEKFGLFNYHWIMYLFSSVSFLIFVFDLCKRKLNLNKYQISLLMMMATLFVSSVASGIFQTYFGAAVYETVLLLTLLMFVTVFYSYVSEVTDGEWKRTILFIVKSLLVFFVFVDIVSVAMFITKNYSISIQLLGQTREISVALEVDSIYNFQIGGEKTYRFIGLFSDPNTAGFINVSLICLALYGMENKNLKKWFGVFAIIVAFVVVVMSKSRNAMLAMLPIVIIALRKMGQSSKRLASMFASKALRRKIRVALGCILFAVLIFVIHSVLIKTDGYSSEELYNLLNLFTGARMTVWSRAILEGMEKTWLGYGYYIEMPFWKIVPLAHNLFINLFNFGGLIALIFGGYAIFGILGKAWKSYGNLEKQGYGGLVALLFSVFLMSLLDNCIIARVEIETALFWLIAGLVSSNKMVLV